MTIKHTDMADIVWAASSSTTITMESFAPIISQHDSDLYRVLMDERNDKYTIHTGDNMFRILASNDLPDEIKSKLSMIKAYEPKADVSMDIWTQVATSAISQSIYSPISLYSSTFPPEFDDVGWKCVTGQYCVILTHETLASLRGETL